MGDPSKMAVCSVLAFVAAVVILCSTTEAAYGYSGSITPENYNEVSMTMCRFDEHLDFRGSPNGLIPSRASTCCVPGPGSEAAAPDKLTGDRFVRNQATPCSESVLREKLTLEGGELSNLMFSSEKRPLGEYPASGEYKDKWVPSDATLPDMTGGVDNPEWSTEYPLTNGEKLHVLLTRCKYAIYNLTKLPMGPPKRYRLWMTLCGNRGAQNAYDLDYDDTTVEFGRACQELQTALHKLYQETCCTCHEVGEIFKGVRTIASPNTGFPKTRTIPVVGKCDDLPQYWMGRYSSRWISTVRDFNKRFCEGCGSSEAGIAMKKKDWYDDLRAEKAYYAAYTSDRCGAMRTAGHSVLPLALALMVGVVVVVLEQF